MATNTTFGTTAATTGAAGGAAEVRETHNLIASDKVEGTPCAAPTATRSALSSAS